MSERYNHIWYKDCPHFTIGKVDQWGERGYLLYEQNVYSYMEDRKEQYCTVKDPVTISEFYEYARNRNIEIPNNFKQELNKS